MGGQVNERGGTGRERSRMENRKREGEQQGGRKFMRKGPPPPPLTTPPHSFLLSFSFLKGRSFGYKGENKIPFGPKWRGRKKEEDAELSLPGAKGKKMIIRPTFGHEASVTFFTLPRKLQDVHPCLEILFVESRAGKGDLFFFACVRE